MAGTDLKALEIWRFPKYNYCSTIWKVDSVQFAERFKKSGLGTGHQIPGIKKSSSPGDVHGKKCFFSRKSSAELISLTRATTWKIPENLTLILEVKFCQCYNVDLFWMSI